MLKGQRLDEALALAAGLSGIVLVMVGSLIAGIPDPFNLVRLAKMTLLVLVTAFAVIRSARSGRRSTEIASAPRAARIHSISGIPMMTAGSAGGRIKTGIHVSAIGEPVTRVGFTIQQVMGVPVEKWGQGSMQTSKPVSEILI